ncbi:MAG: flagellar basal body P-ring protein FlgI [Sedimentisphaerales bacterium]|nr:flagellar basal body P-ring protein FlgI [Sedimentisphaerales bacterium]
MRRINQMNLILLLCMAAMVPAARIKDIVEVDGEWRNLLSGWGLVVGLNDTGDSSLPSAQVLSSLLRNEGISLSPSLFTSGSIALVNVMAELPAYAMQGSTIPITISTVGDAKSLQGGQLLPTELRGFDGEVYAVTLRTAISTASWTAEGKTGSSMTKNHPTAGRIEDGATIVRSEVSEIIQTIAGRRYMTLKLRKSDATTAEHVRQAIEQAFPNSVFVESAGTIRIRVPDTVTESNVNRFRAQIEQLNVEVDIPAVVVINEKTGTIVVGGNVTILETAVAQGSLVVKIKEQQFVSQPIAPFTSGATTAVVDDTSMGVEEEEGYLIRVPQVVTVSELVEALNAIGATPRDLIAIFNALKEAGALQAEIRMM